MKKTLVGTHKPTGQNVYLVGGPDQLISYYVTEDGLQTTAARTLAIKDIEFMSTSQVVKGKTPAESRAGSISDTDL